MAPSFLGEYLGTMTLIIFGGGVCANVLLSKSKGENSGWMVIATGWFVAVVLAVFVARSAGAPNADVNPCVTLAKFYLGVYTQSAMWSIWLAQLLGGFCGGIVVWLAYLPHWKVTENQLNKLSVFCTTPAIRCYPSNTLCEIIGSIMLVFGVGAIFGKATLSHPASGMGPYLVGVLVWGIGLSLGGPTGYAINPARDLGPRLAHAILPISGKGSSDWAYAWVPIAGPLLGGIIGGVLWKYIFGFNLG
jgi:glycerol uptake facilitator protein